MIYNITKKHIETILKNLNCKHGIFRIVNANNISETCFKEIYYDVYNCRFIVQQYYSWKNKIICDKCYYIDNNDVDLLINTYNKLSVEKTE